MKKEKIALVIAVIAICVALYSAMKNIDFSKPHPQQVDTTSTQSPPPAPGDAIINAPPAAYAPSASSAGAGTGVANYPSSASPGNDVAN